MNNEFITINEAILNCNICETTVRRWISKHKNTNNAILKKHDTIYLNSKLFYESYPSCTSHTDVRHEQNKELAEFTLEKQQNDIIKQSQDILKELINQRQKTSYLPLWITIGFIIIFIVASWIAYSYKTELINYYSQQIKTTTSHLQETKAELLNTREELIKSKNDLLNAQKKYNEKSEELLNKDKKIYELEAEIKILSSHSLDTENKSPTL